MADSNSTAPAPIAIFFQVFINQVFINSGAHNSVASFVPFHLRNGQPGISCESPSASPPSIHQTHRAPGGTSSGTAPLKQKFPWQKRTGWMARKTDDSTGQPAIISCPPSGGSTWMRTGRQPMRKALSEPGEGEV